MVNVNRVAEVVVLPVLQTLNGSFIILFVSIAVLVIAKATALFLIIGLLFAYLSISLLIIPQIREGNKKRIEVEMDSNNILNEALKSIVDVKLTNSENFFNQKYRNELVNETTSSENNNLVIEKTSYKSEQENVPLYKKNDGLHTEDDSLSKIKSFGSDESPTNNLHNDLEIPAFIRRQHN